MTRKMMSMESTYQGYISSTHDALLVFECVRRGILPKVKRRLREEERKYIRSGQVFVFDERESGIKRWTDGLLWSPSRILWNFLVYRQVEKKFGNRGGLMQDSNEDLNPTIDPSLYHLEEASRQDQTDGYALGVEPLSAYSDKGFNNAIPSTSRESISPMHHDNANLPHGVYINAYVSLPTWQHDTSIYNAETAEMMSASEKKDAQDERNLVGSLRSSYPFARGGLCKKTISIHIDGSIQHLISYYTVDDVRSGRLRTPSSLPEIASLAISPQLLTKTSFRFPPAIVVGPDGVPRFRGEEGGKLDGLDDTNDELIGRIDYQSMPQRARPMRQIQHPNQEIQHYYKNGFKQSQAQTQALMTAQSMQHEYVGADQYYSMDVPPVHKSPLPHQIGGSGTFEPSKRRKFSVGKYSAMSENRYEEINSCIPSKLPGSSFAHGNSNVANINHRERSGQLSNIGLGRVPQDNEERRQQMLQLLLLQQQQQKEEGMQHVSKRPQNQPNQIRNSVPNIMFDSTTQWPHSDEAAIMKMAVANSAHESISRTTDPGRHHSDDGIDPPPQYMPHATVQGMPQQAVYWQNDHAIHLQRQSTLSSASVSPLPSHAPLAFVPSQRLSSAAGRQSIQMPMQQPGQMTAVSQWAQQQPSLTGPACGILPAYDSNNISPAMQGLPLHYTTRPQDAYHRPMNQAMLIQGQPSHIND